jgi:hypothetical protein
LFKKHPREQQNLKDKFFTGGEKNFRAAPGVKFGELLRKSLYVSLYIKTKEAPNLLPKMSASCIP